MAGRRVYADTSVYGGAFDPEFEGPSRAFFEEVRQGRFALATSALVPYEIAAAPPQVRALFEEMVNVADVADVPPSAVRLQAAYLAAGILPEGSATDALHVAAATVAGCEIIVSWNFRDFVHFDRIPKYNAVNTIHGYGGIKIHSPNEVIGYEDQDV
jgi:predicted nucleic acid-binding protein